MSLFAIADLHLSLYRKKTMDIFGDNWRNHCEKIKENWCRIVGKDDTVLLPGDISWAMNMKEVKPDINFIHELKGKKVILSGNHDYWWGSTSDLNDMYEDIFFLKNYFYPFGDFAVCGTRGWLCPNDTYFDEHDKKIYLREAGRLRFSLDSAVNSGFEKIIVMTHFPPTNDKKENSLFIDIIKSYSVDKVVYGHLHGKDNFNSSLLGKVDGVEYILVSSDYLDFKPALIV